MVNIGEAGVIIIGGVIKTNLSLLLLLLSSSLEMTTGAARS